MRLQAKPGSPLGWQSGITGRACLSRVFLQLQYSHPPLTQCQLANARQKISSRFTRRTRYAPHNHQRPQTAAFGRVYDAVVAPASP